MSKNKGLSSRAVIGTFFQRLEAAETLSWVGDISMYFTSDQESEEYKWLGMAPAMREHIGGRKAKGFRENGIVIVNKEFEATLEVPVAWLRRDKTGQLMVRIDEMVDRSVNHWGSLLSGLIARAEATNCYDGKYFFDTDHEEGKSGQQSNHIGVTLADLGIATHGTPTKPSVAAVREMILHGVQQMLGFKDDEGEPMNEMARKFQIQVPVHWLSTALAAIGSQIVNGDSNVIAALDGFEFDVQVNPRLTWTDKLAVFRTDGAAAPFIRQDEVGIQVRSIAEGSELEFNENMHHHGISASRGVGLGYWQQAVLVQAV